MDTKIWHLIFAIGFLIPIKAESAEVCKLQPVQRASSVEIPSAVMILTQSRAVVEHGNGTTYVYDCDPAFAGGGGYAYHSRAMLVALLICATLAMLFRQAII
jgi:hypothetical protein